MEIDESKLFTWVPFYEELASCLVPYRSHSKDLVMMLEELRAEGLTITRLDDQDAAGSRFPLDEIDPFTFFGVFNRQILEETRIRILQALKQRLAVRAGVPSDFAGVPVMQNQASWFFSYQHKRLPGDIETLWKVFELALAPTPLDDPVFAHAFDEALQVRQVNFNLTMGLFWVRPRMFLNLDGVNRKYLDVDLPKGGLTFTFYKTTVDEVRSTNGSDFARLSHEAWKARGEPPSGVPWKGKKAGTAIGYWLVNAISESDDPPDQTDRFLAEGVWENPYPDRYLDEVKAMKVGDHVAIKTVSAERKNLPFDSGGRTVTVMRVKALGTIVSNPGDGRSIEVEWQARLDPPRLWYFFTRRNAVWQLREDWEYTPALIRSIFEGQPQDYEFLAKRFSEFWRLSPDERSIDAQEEIETAKPYSVKDLTADGVFLNEQEIERILRRLQTKKNLILQGAPGVGKTFFAKRRAYAVMEAKDPARVTTVQFHPSYSYEDFVRGYRPSSDAGRFVLVDGPFLQLCRRADQDPDHRYVLIIDEINRGNISQIFGELMMLIESDKRGRDYAITPVYRKDEQETLYIPSNLYILGTMNIADRSLALVDYALRRRFAFLTLEPQFASKTYREWLEKHGMAKDLISRIVQKMTALNVRISEDPQLGEAYRVGHSFFCPSGKDFSSLGESWFMDVVETEIRPLVEEYWFDNRDKACNACDELLGSAW